MEAVSVDQVIARIEQLATSMNRPVLVTDADGTLWSGDVGFDAFEALLAEGGVREEARAALEQEARAAGVPVHGDATRMAQAIYDAFRTDAFDEVRAYEVMAWAFAGRTVEQAREHAARVQRERGLEGRVLPEMRDILRWALARGLEVWVVSASPQFVVEEAVLRLGIAPENVIGAEAAIRDGRIDPRMANPMPYGAGKTQAIERVLGPVQLVAAFGDSAFDAHMLEAAALPVAVRPKQKLRALSPQLPALVELVDEQLVPSVAAEG